MSFFRRLWKRSDETPKNTEADFDAINSLSSAYIALETKLHLTSTGRTAICIKRANTPQFNEMKQEIEKFLEASKADLNSLFVP
jgi:hypothetical protein